MIIKKQFAILFTLLFTLSLSNQIQLHDQMVIDFDVNPDQSLTVKIELADIELDVINQNNQNFTSVSIPGQYFTNTPGFPQLPQINQLIEIPYEATPQIEIINVTEEIYNLDEPGLYRLISLAYKHLGLITFFTAGEKEIRAWTIHKNYFAPQAAGVIHTDFERGFIKAEVYHINDLIEYKTELSLKDNGKIRQEGKDYLVKDGDIIFFKFNI